MAQLSDDWLMEIDILSSIFMDQLKLREESKTIEISLWPNPDSKDPGENQVGAMVTLTFKKDYPNEGPEMSLKPLKGVTSKQSKELMEKLETQAQESLGMPMLFALTQTVKDWLDEQNMDSISKQKEAAKAQDELEMEKEKEEYARKYKDGTAVTVDGFKTWWIKFLASHPEKPQWPAAEGPTPVVVKLTGKQLFERGALANVDLEGLAGSAASPSPLTSSSSSVPAASASKTPEPASAAVAAAGAQDWGLFEDDAGLPSDDEE